jgi:hypothetical protein
MKYYLSVLAFVLIACSGTASAEILQTAPVQAGSDRDAIRAANAKADAADRETHDADHEKIRAARSKAEAAEKADGLPKSWDRDANGKRPWEH